jgi:putative hydrolase of the HAD superfamily
MPIKQSNLAVRTQFKPIAQSDYPITQLPNYQMHVSAVFFDVDFTLIRPGPTFQGVGYQAFCARYGIGVDPARFETAVASALRLLDDLDDDAYRRDLFIAFTRHIIEQMGGSGPRLDACAEEIYREWAACHHFELYDEVPQVLQELSRAGLRIGLISNTERCLQSFQSHFELRGLIAAAISSFEHGYMKPHPSIFAAALARIGARPDQAVMVGDSLRQDIEGALAAGMRAIWLRRGTAAPATEHEVTGRGVRVIGSLRELPGMLMNLVNG